ncbi:MAG TPA: hypothetical protein VN969_19370 [Streptosporangiaceae bacterium]|nr:hypothetical protein [Streptosporangiaceae bacterium]
MISLVIWVFPRVLLACGPPGPGAHDLGGQPVPADLSLGDDGHSVERAQRVGAPGQVLLLDCEVSGRPCHDGSILGRAGRKCRGHGNASGGTRPRPAPAEAGHVVADYRIGDACHPVLGDPMSRIAFLKGSSRDVRGGCGLRGAGTGDCRACSTVRR